MSGDTSPSGDITDKLHSVFAKCTNFVDHNIRIIQYSVYAVAALGTWRLLHGVRAFSLFAKVKDIPHEFVRKNVRLRGKVRWVGRTLPDSNGDIVTKSPVEHTSQVTPEMTSLKKATESNLDEQSQIIKSKKNASLGEARLDADNDIYMIVEHVPVVSVGFSSKSSSSLSGCLPVRVAAIHLTDAAADAAALRFINRKVWFTPLSIDLNNRVLDCAIGDTKFRLAYWRSLNENLVRSGEAIVASYPEVSQVQPLYDETPWRPWSVFWKDSTDLVVSDEGAEPAQGITVGYDKLYRKLTVAQDIAMKKNRGVWADRNWLNKPLYVRIFKRFVRNVRERKQ